MSLAISIARSIARLAGRRSRPATGRCRWRRCTPRPCAAASAIFCASARSAPSSAAIAPSPTGTACCIAWPRSFSSFAVVARSNEPAAHSAEYSPRLWPATKLATSARSNAPSSREHRDRMRHDRRLRILGELELVLRPLAHQPEQVLAERLVDFVEHVRARPGSRRASAAPMPTAWLPCPGKMNARMDALVQL